MLAQALMKFGRSFFSRGRRRGAIRPCLSLCAALGLALCATSAVAEESPHVEDEATAIIWESLISELERFEGEDGAPGVTLHWRKIVGFEVLRLYQPERITQLAAFQYLGETARTDKQVGSNASSLGTTSLLEKPGIASLLAVALERGAIQQETSGTNVNLRTSPAMILRAFYRGDGDLHAEEDPLYDWLGRIGASATIPTTDSVSAEGSSIDLNEVTDWSVQVNLNWWGNRTVYSKQFIEWWRTHVSHLQQDRVAAKAAVQEVIGNDEALGAEVKDSAVALSGEIQSLLQRQSAQLPKLEAISPERMRLRVRSNAVMLEAYAMVRTVLGKVASKVRSRLSEEQLQQLGLQADQVSASNAALARAKSDLKSAIKDVIDVPVLSAAYTNHKALVGSNYSEGKLLFQYRVNLPLTLFPEPFDLLGNADISFFHDPDESMNQDSLRSFGAGLGAEFAFDNPFVGFASDADLSSITLLFAGRVSRLETEEDEAGYAQAKLEIPVAAGLTLPLSVTYASRTEENTEDEVRGNFGFTLDTDKLYALAALATMGYR